MNESKTNLTILGAFRRTYILTTESGIVRLVLYDPETKSPLRYTRVMWGESEDITLANHRATRRSGLAE
jgi:hypothetical protein